MFLFHDRLIFIYTIQATLLNYIIINESVQYSFFLGRGLAIMAGTCFLSQYPGSTLSICTYVIPVMTYMPTGLAGCSVGSRISHGACKLARTPHVIYKKSVQYSWLSERYIIVITMCFKI